MGSDEKVEQSSNVESALKDMCGAFGNELSRERMAAGVNTLLREVDARIAKAIQWSPVEVTKQWAQSAADANRLKVTREMFSSPRATDSTPVVTFTPVPSSPSSVRDAIGSFYGKHVVVTMKDGSKHQGVLRDYGVGGEVGIGTRSGISIADIVSVTTMGPCDEPIEATPEPLGHLGPARLRQLAEHHPKVRGELRWAADEIERLRALVPTGHKSWHDDRREVARLYRWLVNRDYFDDHDTAVFIEYPETFAAEYAEMCREQPYPSGLEAALTELTEEGHLEPDRALQWRASMVYTPELAAEIVEAMNNRHVALCSYCAESASKLDAERTAHAETKAELVKIVNRAPDQGLWQAAARSFVRERHVHLDTKARLASAEAALRKRSGWTAWDSQSVDEHFARYPEAKR